MAHVMHGEPLVVDTFVRPIASGARWLVGAFGAGGLAWLDLWWWVPVPLVLATVAMEGVLLLRADRAIELRLEDDKAVVEDVFSATLTIRWDQVHACTVLRRPRRDGWEAVVVLASRRRVLCSVAFQLAVPPDVGRDVDDIDRHLGAQAGLLRATAPPARAVRQRFHDPLGLATLLAHVPTAAREREALRLWFDMVAHLSPFGHHTEDPSVLMVLDDDGWELVDDDGEVIQQGNYVIDDWWVAEREAVLLRVEGADDTSVGVLPLLVLRLGDTFVAVPAPSLAGHPKTGPRFDRVLHTHAPEAVALIARLAPSWGVDMPPPWASDMPPGPGGPPG